MKGEIFITRTGYDPQLGKHIKDPTLGPVPTLGACHPDFRKKLQEGDHLFVVSGKIQRANQFIMGGFEIEAKIDATEAYKMFPENRLRMRPDGQLTGNIIVDSTGMQHSLDDHKTFQNRTPNYVVGTNLLALESDSEIEMGRQETMEVLRTIFQKNSKTPFELIGHYGKSLNERQILEIRDWLDALKKRFN